MKMNSADIGVKIYSKYLIRNRYRDLKTKLHKYQADCGFINRTLQNRARRYEIITFYDETAASVLLCGEKSCVLLVANRERSRIQTTGMIFLRRAQKCTGVDRIRISDARSEGGVYQC